MRTQQRTQQRTEGDSRDNALKFYIDGQWVAPHSTATLPVINPATEAVIGTVAIGDEQDVDRAVKAARRAFESFSQTSIDERAALLEKIIAVYKRRMPEIAEAVSKEMGAPMSLASAAQAPSGLGHLMHALKALKAFEWEKDVGRCRVVHEAIGIKHGQITTIHDPTNTNLVVDAPHKDLRRARSAMLSLQPTTTGSATAIALIYPELKGKLDGHAVRAPVLNASLTDCVFELSRETTRDEVNALFAEAAAGPLAGILGYEPRPLVSADYARDTRSSIVDGLSTLVTDGTLLKVYAWYDNEMGYACRMVDLACHMREAGI